MRNESGIDLELREQYLFFLDDYLVEDSFEDDDETDREDSDDLNEESLFVLFDGFGVVILSLQ